MSKSVVWRAAMTSCTASRRRGMSSSWTCQICWSRKTESTTDSGCHPETVAANSETGTPPDRMSSSAGASEEAPSVAPRPNCLVIFRVPQLVESPYRHRTADSPPPSTTNSANSVPSTRVERSIAASPNPRPAGEEGEWQGAQPLGSKPGLGPPTSHQPLPQRRTRHGGTRWHAADSHDCAVGTPPVAAEAGRQKEWSAEKMPR